MTEVGDRTFENCYMLQNIEWGGEGCQFSRIGHRAFYGCNSLPQEVIPESVQDIGVAAFMGCTYMEDIDLPASLRSISDNAFANGTSVTRMTVRATTPPDIAAHTFYRIDRSIPVYVPSSAYAEYASHVYWKEFNLQRMDGETTGQDAVTAPAQSITVCGSEIIINRADTPLVSLYDVSGRLIHQGRDRRITVPQADVYVVTVGQEAVKVTVR